MWALSVRWEENSLLILFAWQPLFVSKYTHNFILSLAIFWYSSLSYLLYYISIFKNCSHPPINKFKERFWRGKCTSMGVGVNQREGFYRINFTKLPLNLKILLLSHWAHKILQNTHGSLDPPNPNQINKSTISLTRPCIKL